MAGVAERTAATLDSYLAAFPAFPATFPTAFRTAGSRAIASISKGAATSTVSESAPSSAEPRAARFASRTECRHDLSKCRFFIPSDLSILIQL